MAQRSAAAAIYGRAPGTPAAISVTDLSRTMKRILLAVFVITAILVTLVVAGSAAPKSYQFTGVVKTVDGGSLTVEKNAKETWQFETSKDTKGTPKPGDRVTVSYRMVATEIASNSAK